MVRVKFAILSFVTSLKECTSWFLVGIGARPHWGAHLAFLRNSWSSYLCLLSTGFYVCTTVSAIILAGTLEEMLVSMALCGNVYPLLPSMFLSLQEFFSKVIVVCLFKFLLSTLGGTLGSVNVNLFSNHFSVHPLFFVLRSIHSSCASDYLV